MPAMSPEERRERGRRAKELLDDPLLREAFARACADPTLDRLCFITHPDWADPWIPESNPVLEYSLFREGLWGGMLWRLTKYRRRMQEKARD